MATRPALAAVGAIVLSAGLAGGLLYREFRQLSSAHVEVWAEELVTRVSDSYSELFGKVADVATTHAKLLSSQPNLARRPDDLGALLRLQLAGRPEISTLLFADTSGAVVGGKRVTRRSVEDETASLLAAEPEDYDARSKRWYFDALDRRSAVWDATSTGGAERLPAVSVPIYDRQGGLVGVLRVVMSRPALIQAGRDAVGDPGRYVALYTADLNQLWLTSDAYGTSADSAIRNRAAEVLDRSAHATPLTEEHELPAPTGGRRRRVEIEGENYLLYPLSVGPTADLPLEALVALPLSTLSIGRYDVSHQTLVYAICGIVLLSAFAVTVLIRTNRDLAKLGTAAISDSDDALERTVRKSRFREVSGAAEALLAARRRCSRAEEIARSEQIRADHALVRFEEAERNLDRSIGEHLASAAARPLVDAARTTLSTASVHAELLAAEPGRTTHQRAVTDSLVRDTARAEALLSRLAETMSGDEAPDDTTDMLRALSVVLPGVKERFPSGCRFVLAVEGNGPWRVRAPIRTAERILAALIGAAACLLEGVPQLVAVKLMLQRDQPDRGRPVETGGESKPALVRTAEQRPEPGVAAWPRTIVEATVFTGDRDDVPTDRSTGPCVPAFPPSTDGGAAVAELIRLLRRCEGTWSAPTVRAHTVVLSCMVPSAEC